MNKEASIKHWKQMWKRLTDPEEKAKIKRKAQTEKSREEKIRDTGL